MDEIRGTLPGMEEEQEDMLNPDALIWRRFHLSVSKLKNVINVASLMAGFSVVCTVELHIEKDTPEPLLVLFTVITALLVTTTMLALMIATCILPHLEVIAKLESSAFLKNSAHDELVKYIDLSWALTNTASTFLFVVDVIVMSWIKFQTLPASIAATSIMMPVLGLLILFAVVFHRRTVAHQYRGRRGLLEETMALYDVRNMSITTQTRPVEPSGSPFGTPTSSRGSVLNV